MIFQRKYERAMNHLKEQRGESPKALEDENLSDKLEKNDTLALILSALIVLVPAALIVLLIVTGIGYFWVSGGFR
ncbi:MAG: hypothetical protein IKK75_05040 [Clostridia bacterium]|nr:hypothetical protein [Clostridia bacterium]